MESWNRSLDQVKTTTRQANASAAANRSQSELSEPSLPENEAEPPRNQEKFLQQQGSEQLEWHTQYYQGGSKKWDLSAKVQTAESNQMSRPTEQHLEQRRRSRAHPGPRCFLRGPTWAMEDSTTSKQISKCKVIMRQLKCQRCGSQKIYAFWEMNDNTIQGGKLLWKLRCTRRSSNDLSQRCLDVSETLLHGGMDSSRQIISK